MPNPSILDHGRRLARGLAWAGSLLLAAVPALAHRDGAYWHDSGPAGHNPQWMLTVSPTKTLADLSLPGTHDSGTYPGIGGPNVRTQTMTIGQQLESGIRWMDIRLKYFDPIAIRECNAGHVSANCQLMVFHGVYAQFVLFERDVLVPTIAFLRANPSETVVMRIAMETSQCDCDPGPTLNALLAREAVLNGQATGQKYSDYLLPLKCPWPQQLTLGAVRPLNARPDPASCDARGKLLIYDQYMTVLADNHAYRHETDKGTYAGPAYGPLNTIKDYYDDLWLPVKRHLQAANTTPPPSQRLYQAGISDNGPSFPFFFASGHTVEDTDAPRLSTGLVQGITADASTWPDFPRTACVGSLCTISYEGMNILVADLLMRPEFHLPGSRVGIVSADFPGERFITAVASVNGGVSFNRPNFGYTLTTGGRAYQPGSWANQAVLVNPVCNVVCFGDRTSVTEDLPNGFTYTMVGGGHTVQFLASPVRIDLVRPTITAAATTAPGPSGWYTGNVTVHFSCDDTGGSGVVDCAPDQLFSRDGIATSSGAAFALDAAGNKSNPSNVVTVKIDRTPPTVTYRGNLGSYAPGQLIDIRCEATDRDSGVASSTCAGIQGLASSFGPGVHRFSARATDVAGNSGTGATSFTVVALPGDVSADGVLDCRDVALVKAAFGKRAGMVGFDARADTNGDGVVDIRDLAFVTQQMPAGTVCA